jgi:hypothetical protein
MMSNRRKDSPRAEYRLLRNERVNHSTSLSECFPDLKTLVISLDYFDPSGTTRTSALKYKANLEHAKSVFCFNCVSQICVGGDYDLSQILSQAVAKRKTSVAGELRCQGILHDKERREPAPCQSILRYTLALRF